MYVFITIIVTSMCIYVSMCIWPKGIIFMARMQDIFHSKISIGNSCVRYWWSSYLEHKHITNLFFCYLHVPSIQENLFVNIVMPKCNIFELERLLRRIHRLFHFKIYFHLEIMICKFTCRLFMALRS